MSVICWRAGERAVFNVAYVMKRPRSADDDTES